MKLTFSIILVFFCYQSSSQITGWLVPSAIKEKNGIHFLKESNDSLKGETHTFEFYQNGLVKSRILALSNKNLNPDFLDSNHLGDYSYSISRYIYDENSQMISSAQTLIDRRNYSVQITRYSRNLLSDSLTTITYNEYTGASNYRKEYRPLANDTINISPTEFHVISIGGNLMYTCKNFISNGCDSLVCTIDTNCISGICGITNTYQVTKNGIYKRSGSIWKSLDGKSFTDSKVVYDKKGLPFECQIIRKNPNGVSRSKYKVEIEFFEKSRFLDYR